MFWNELDIFKKYKRDIEYNKDFEYVLKKYKFVMVDLKLGYYVINCMKCNFICYKKCKYGDDNDKIKCCVMVNGYCIVCIKKCKWNDYKNMWYIFE